MSFKARYFSTIPFLFGAILLISCESKEKKELTESYQDSLSEWKAARVHDVINNWLPLVGLKWLEEGENTFGSDSSNNLVLPPSAPSRIGHFNVTGDTVKMIVALDVKVFSQDSIIKDSEIKAIEGAVFRIGEIEWTVILRAGKFALRIWNRSSTNTRDFSLEYFETRPQWILDAKFEPYPEGKTYPIANVMGSTTDTPIPGKLVFSFKGKKYNLDVMEGEKDSWFVIFADETNGEETYGAGRYLYVNKALEQSSIIVDFNKAYNPPCAFTQFATCPLPPPQNRLALVIDAGEKNSLPEF